MLSNLRMKITRGHSPSRHQEITYRRSLVLAAVMSHAIALFSAAFWAGECEAAPQQSVTADLEALVSAQFDHVGSGGVVLVVRNGETLLRRAYRMAHLELGVPMTAEHVLGTGSITKQFTSVAILQLVAQGKLALDDDVRRHLPQFQSYGKRITIEQLLSHTSGYPNIVDRPDFETLSRREMSLDQLMASTRDMPLHFEPGQGFRYSDSGYFALGAVIEAVSGQKYASYLEEELFRPLGMEHTWYADDARIIPGRAAGYSLRDGKVINAPHMSMTIPHAAGAVFSTVDDLARWDQALRSLEVLPKALLERAWSVRKLPDGTTSGYGLGWKVCSLAGHRTIEHGGFVNGFGAQLLRLPDDDLTIAILVNNDGDIPDAGALARRIARWLLTGSPIPAYQKLTPPQRAALVGTYAISGEDHRVISARDEGLFSKRSQGPEFQLYALSPSEFSIAGDDDALVFRFTIQGNGLASSVRPFLRCEPSDEAVRVERAPER